MKKKVPALRSKPGQPSVWPNTCWAAEMARDDWFRNTDWNPAIEEAFFAKLSRARDKAQYLRIQASILAQKHPTVALRLLDQYFSLGEHFDHAQAHVDRASAYLSLGDTDQAISSYETALAVEDRRPKMITETYLNLPFVVVYHGIKARYEQALHLLEQHKSRLMFPVDHFRWHAAHALILLELGHIPAAREHAQIALNAAAKDHSGFRFHPRIGLVGKNYESIRQKLSALAA
jgi:tetratricopeptide (TPR) repeat protein